jgi:TPR repeat protein
LIEFFCLPLSHLAGNSASQFNLGCMYHNGIGVAQSTASALHYYHMAAQQNNADALNCLGVNSFQSISLRCIFSFFTSCLFFDCVWLFELS